MATINFTKTDPQPGKKQVITWSNVTENDTCATFTFQELAQDISIGIDGTWGGATATIVGSNGTEALACTALGGTTASWTADALFSLLERPASITPTFSGGSSQSLTVTMVLWF